MRVCHFCFVILLVLFACSSKPKRPEGVLPKEKMIEVMVDFQLAEASILYQQNHQQNVGFYTYYYYDTILKKHGISRADFRKSIDWYKNHLEEIDDIYGEVLSRLSSMQPDAKK